MDYYSELTILAKISLACFCGGLIGYERETANKPAGFRTQMLVSGAAVLLVSMAEAMAQRHVGVHQIDPARSIEALVTGIAFLGAGTILKEKGTTEIQGLTTSASLLFAGGIGISIALDHLVLAGGATILVLLILRVLAQFGKTT